VSADIKPQPHHADGSSMNTERGVDLADRVDRQITRASLRANLIGAGIVFACLAVLGPGVEEPDIGRLLLINVPALFAYMTAALVGGRWLARRSDFDEIRRWLSADRPATAAEQELVLRYPVNAGVRVTAIFWGVGAIFFALINLTISGGLAAVILITVPLGGIATCAVTYLLDERLMRPIAVLALAGDPPERPALLGVAGRIAIAWIAGTGVPVLGLAALGVADLIGLNLYGNDEITLASTVALLALVAFAGGLVTVYLAARSVADPIAAVRDAVQKVERGQLDARVPVDDASEVGLLEVGFNRMAAGLEERERIRDLFGRHVGRDVASAALVETEAKLGGEEREVAALFVDLVGSTKLANELPATDVVVILNDFFRVVVEVTESNGGFVNKFEGDAALCVFGAPAARDDPSGDALRAAREIDQRLRNEVAVVDLGMGVSAGMAVAGNVGALERFEYTVIGDPVNEAARLCELAKQRPGRLLASEAAVRLAGAEERDRWSLRETVTLRGRTDRTRLATPT
jgi:adenylate cyclase